VGDGWGTAGGGGGRQGTAGDGGGRRKRAENNGKERKTAGDGGGRWGTVGHGPSLGRAGQVPGKTGRDDKLPSVLVLAQDGRTAPLRTLATASIVVQESLSPSQ